jgi:poly-gamma-glutamate capsule biosynthesis protein CapA/YwtB (metallophosphatase superfamily)
MRRQGSIRQRALAGAWLIALGASVLACSSAVEPAATPTSAATLEAAASTPAPTPPPSPTPLSIVRPTRTPVPLVPIVGFWSTRRSVGLAEVARLVAGNFGAIRPAPVRVLIANTDAQALGQSLGVTIGAHVEIASAADVEAAVRASNTTLGIVRADDVTPDVRALAVGNVSLFGSGRVETLYDWPLTVSSTTPSSFDPQKAWTLAAGGDVNFERNVYVYAVKRKLGPDYPWTGGYAAIKRHYCCGFEKNLLVQGRRLGSAGAFRDVMREADLALVNLEGPAPNNFTYHDDGLTFSFDPALLVGLRDAGIDGVSMANNHLRNAGDQGVLDTMANLDKVGVKHAGAGSRLSNAARPAWFVAGGMLIAFLAYDQLQAGNFATNSRPGAAPYKISSILSDIRAVRAAGADFVVVMPHWGAEYSLYVSAQQRRDAASMVAAGADVILGSHSHYTGAIEAINRSDDLGPAFVDYSLGDLLFDLNYSEATQEGVVANLTYVGRKLVQIDLLPTMMVDHSQVNLMDPAGDGQVVLNRIRSASKATFHW